MLAVGRPNIDGSTRVVFAVAGWRAGQKERFYIAALFKFGAEEIDLTFKAAKG